VVIEEEIAIDLEEVASGTDGSLYSVGSNVNGRPISYFFYEVSLTFDKKRPVIICAAPHQVTPEILNAMVPFSL